MHNEQFKRGRASAARRWADFIVAVASLLLLVGCPGQRAGGGDSVFFDGENNETLAHLLKGTRIKVLAQARRMKTGGYSVSNLYDPALCSSTKSTNCAMFATLSDTTRNRMRQIVADTLDTLITKNSSAPITQVEVVTEPLFVWNLSANPPVKVPQLAVASYQKNKILFSPSFAKLTQEARETTYLHEVFHTVYPSESEGAYSAALEAEAGLYAAGLQVSLGDVPPAFSPDTWFNHSAGETDNEKLGLLKLDLERDNTPGDQSIDEAGRALAFQPDGKILIAGTTKPGLAPTALFVARLLPEGRLDPDFNADGNPKGVAFARYDGNPTRGRSVAVLGDGSILVATEVTHGARNKVAFAKFDATGELVPSYGDNGFLLMALEPRLEVTAMMVTANGSVLAAGRTCRSGAGCDPIVIKLTPQGTPDSSFGNVENNPGIARLVIAGSASWSLASINVDRKGRVVAAGKAASGGVVVRFTATGQPDADFGPTKRGHTDAWGREMKFVVDTDRGLVSCGSATSSSTRGALWRITENGFADSTFDGDGWNTAGITGVCVSVIPISGGRLVAAIQRNSTNQMAFAIFNHNGTLDQAQYVVFPYNKINLSEVAAQPSDGMIVIYGHSPAERDVFVKRIFPPL